jgi:hypothetical protein
MASTEPLDAFLARIDAFLADAKAPALRVDDIVRLHQHLSGELLAAEDDWIQHCHRCVNEEHDLRALLQ